MYGLIGTFIITVMIGVLAVTSNMGLPDSDLLIGISDSSITPFYLIIVAILLILITQRSALPSVAANPHFSIRFIRYLLIGLLTSMLIIGSAWQVLSQYQQAEGAKITQPMRVQAWVTIEGISDSVYDPRTNSGYRQVAIVRAISPLVKELSAEDLNKNTAEYIKNNRLNNTKNPTDIKNIDDTEDTKNKEYRILLNAYPKSYTTSKNSKTSKNDTELAGLNELQPGSQLLMSLTLAPLKTSQQAISNPSGFDSYRWLRARHIDGVANVLAIAAPINIVDDSASVMTSSNSYLYRLRVTIDQGRWQLRQHFYQNWAQKTTAQQQARAVTLSLLTGDRSLINRETKDLYQLAGISHLLAISGTHVLFLAIVLAGLATLLIDSKGPSLYRVIPRWQVRWWVMIGAAFIYALFTGFDVPAARTAWMLLAIGLVRLTLLPVSTLRVLLALAILMAWFDPYVLWQAGYWLSFIAVALLLKYDDTLQAQNKDNVKYKSKSNQSAQYSVTGHSNLIRIKLWLLFKQLFKLQCWLFIALLPVSLLLFGKVSLWGLAINLFAIGLFGWVLVPLNLLAGLCYLIAPVVADSIWALVTILVGSLHELIVWLTSLPALESAWLYTSINTGMLLMALLIMLPWLLPRGLISRWLALPPLALLMLTIVSNQQALSLTPTLYVLPTGDRYITAAVLQYPISDKGDDKKLNENFKPKESSASGSASWLFLANHRPDDRRTMSSSLTANKLSETLEQQLRTLAVKRLEGIVIQTSASASTHSSTKTRFNNNERDKTNSAGSELLPTTVAQLSQSLPTKHYWQAGRSDGFSIPKSSVSDTSLSAQRCEQDKIWQLPNGELTLQAITGWPKIEDANVWDCVITLDSGTPINIVQYNGADPQKSANLAAQKLALANNQSSTNQSKNTQSRLILDAATHPRIWDLWSLLCSAKPFAIGNSLDYSTTWLSHSSSQVSAEILTTQKVSEVMTYDAKALEIALALGPELPVD